MTKSAKHRNRLGKIETKVKTLDKSAKIENNRKNPKKNDYTKSKQIENNRNILKKIEKKVKGLKIFEKK